MSQIRIQRDHEGERQLPVFQELSARMDAVREKAFDLFRERGMSSGRALDDWIAAERSILGRTAAEFKEVDGAYQVDLTLPGFTPKEVELVATPSELIVHATIEKERQVEDESVMWSEFASTDVYRHFGFPSSVDADKITARLENGILHVRAPKYATATTSDAEAPPAS